MMKKLIPFFMVAVAILFVKCGNDANGQDAGQAKLKSFEDSLSYSFGVQLAEMLKQQGEDLDPDLVSRAVREAMMDTAQLTVQQCQEIMRSNGFRKAEDVLRAGKAFLEQNAKKEGVQVTESGLQYKILADGTGASPLPESTVTFHYKLSLIDGKQIESSFDTGKPITYPLAQLITGWKEGLQLIKEGGKMELVVPSELGYGPQTSGPIPGGSVLVFEIELLSIAE